MARLLIFLSFLICASFACKNKEWNFGKDPEGSVLVSHQTGRISPLKKVTEINFKVPPCMSVQYVNVAVYNILDATPDITVNENTNTVIISYEVLQPSESTYEVIVKGYHIDGFNSGNQPLPGLHWEESKYITPKMKHKYYYTGDGTFVSDWANNRGVFNSVINDNTGFITGSNGGIKSGFNSQSGGYNGFKGEYHGGYNGTLIHGYNYGANRPLYKGLNAHPANGKFDIGIGLNRGIGGGRINGYDNYIGSTVQNSKGDIRGKRDDGKNTGDAEEGRIIVTSSAGGFDEDKYTKSTADLSRLVDGAIRSGKDNAIADWRDIGGRNYGETGFPRSDEGYYVRSGVGGRTDSLNNIATSDNNCDIDSGSRHGRNH